MNRATIKLSSACSGTVHIARLIVARRVVYETRAWGTAWNAAQDAKHWAAGHGFAVKQ